MSSASKPVCRTILPGVPKVIFLCLLFLEEVLGAICKIKKVDNHCSNHSYEPRNLLLDYSKMNRLKLFRKKISKNTLLKMNFYDWKRGNIH